MRPALSARKWYVLRRLSAPEPSRSAVPLASAGIVCLGLVPLLGAREQPLHWATSGAMVCFGVLLYLRHRVRRCQQPLARVSSEAAREAGRSVLVTAAVIFAMVLIIALQRALAGNPTHPLSLLLPLFTLVWLGWLGSLALRKARQPSAFAPTLSTTPAPSESWKRAAVSGQESKQA